MELTELEKDMSSKISCGASLVEPVSKLVRLVG
jgi:hypothetical protein